MIDCIRKTVIVDILIIIFFLLMLLEEATGLFEDEVLSLVLMVLFAMHIFINRKCITASIQFIKSDKSDKSDKERDIDKVDKVHKKEFAAAIINLSLYVSMIICSIMTILSTDYYIIDFDFDFDEFFVLFAFILVVSFMLHIYVFIKDIGDVIKRKL